MGYHKFLKEGIYLDDYNVFINWSVNQKSLTETIGGFNSFDLKTIGKNTIYFIKSRLFGSEKRFLIAFNFIKDKMISIDLSIENSGQDSKECFYELYEFLKDKFGKPNVHNFIEKLFKEKEDKIFKWKINDVKIVLSLFDFNLRSSIEIIV